MPYSTPRIEQWVSVLITYPPKYMPYSTPRMEQWVSVLITYPPKYMPYSTPRMEQWVSVLITYPPKYMHSTPRMEQWVCCVSVCLCLWMWISGEQKQMFTVLWQIRVGAEDYPFSVRILLLIFMRFPRKNTKKINVLVPFDRRSHSWRILIRLCYW